MKADPEYKEAMRRWDENNDSTMYEAVTSKYVQKKYALLKIENPVLWKTLKELHRDFLGQNGFDKDLIDKIIGDEG